MFGELEICIIFYFSVYLCAYGDRNISFRLCIEVTCIYLLV